MRIIFEDNEMAMIRDCIQTEIRRCIPDLLPANGNGTDKFMTTAELIPFLGSISRSTVYQFIDSGLPVTKIGGRNYFKLSEVMEFMQKMKEKVQ